MTKEEKILIILGKKESQIDLNSSESRKDFFADIKFSDVASYVIKNNISPEGYMSKPGMRDGTYIICSDEACVSYSQERGSIDINPSPRLYSSKREAEMRYLRDVCDFFFIQK